MLTVIRPKENLQVKATTVFNFGHNTMFLSLWNSFICLILVCFSSWSQDTITALHELTFLREVGIPHSFTILSRPFFVHQYKTLCRAEITPANLTFPGVGVSFPGVGVECTIYAPQSYGPHIRLSE